MKNPMNVTQEGINLIKKWEGFRPTKYMCPAGKITIGYGHQITQKDHDHYIASPTVDENKAEIVLKHDLIWVIHSINRKVTTPLTQNQFDALCSLVFNIGGTSFGRCKGIRLLNNQEYDKAAVEFFDQQIGFVKIKGVINQGLVNRRKDESQLWKK